MLFMNIKGLNRFFQETVIPVECFLREPAPVPESDISLSDWVGAVKTYDNQLALFLLY